MTIVAVLVGGLIGLVMSLFCFLVLLRTWCVIDRMATSLETLKLIKLFEIGAGDKVTWDKVKGVCVIEDSDD